MSRFLPERREKAKITLPFPRCLSVSAASSPSFRTSPESTGAGSAVASCAPLGPWGFGLIDNNDLSVKLAAVKLLDGLLGGLLRLHLDKTETLAEPRELVLDDSQRNNVSHCGKIVSQLLLRDSAGQIADI